MKEMMEIITMQQEKYCNTFKKGATSNKDVV